MLHPRNNMGAQISCHVYDATCPYHYRYIIDTGSDFWLCIICTTVIMDQASKKEEQLLKRRIRERARRAAETAEEKELRLSKRRVRDIKARRAERTAQQREEKKLYNTCDANSKSDVLMRQVSKEKTGYS